MKNLLPLTLAAALLTSAALADPPVPAVPPAVPAAPAIPAAPAPPPPPRHAPNMVGGKVSAMDAAKRTLTITSRHDPNGVTVTVAEDAKVMTTKPAALADIKTGDAIVAFAQGGDIAPGAASVDAMRVMLLPALPPMHKGKDGHDPGFARNRVQGTVATTAPTLTVTTPGGATVTITTTPTTRVEQTTMGALSDITVGTNVQARITGDPSAPVATELRIMPARNEGRPHGAAAPNGAATPAPAGQ